MLALPMKSLHLNWCGHWMRNWAVISPFIFCVCDNANVIENSFCQRYVKDTFFWYFAFVTNEESSDVLQQQLCANNECCHKIFQCNNVCDDALVLVKGGTFFHIKSGIPCLINKYNIFSNKNGLDFLFMSKERNQ